MNLDQWMTERKLTDDAFSKLLGISRSQVSRIRKRKSKPSPKVAKRLEELTEIPAASFIFEEVAA